MILKKYGTRGRLEKEGPLNKVVFTTAQSFPPATKPGDLIILFGWGGEGSHNQVYEIVDAATINAIAEMVVVSVESKRKEWGRTYNGLAHKLWRQYFRASGIPELIEADRLSDEPASVIAMWDRPEGVKYE